MTKTLKISKPVTSDGSRKPIRGRNRNNHVAPSSISTPSRSTHSSDNSAKHNSSNTSSRPSNPLHSSNDRPYGKTKPTSKGFNDRPQRGMEAKKTTSGATSHDNQSRDSTSRSKTHRLDHKPNHFEKTSAPPTSTSTYGSKSKVISKNFQEPRRHGKIRDATGRIIKEVPRRLAPSDAGIRLSKHLSDQGICSRREADVFIGKGWVTVNGTRATLGQRILSTDRIQVARQAERAQNARVTILINKPVGVVSGQAEDDYLPAVNLITPDNHWSEDSSDILFENKQLQGIAPAGRLDIDSVGLLVLTQDGRIAKALIGDKSEIDKEYLVRVEGQLTPDGLALLNHGLELDGRPLRPAKVSWQNEDQLRFVLSEGKKRQIRRMCELVGLHVIGLKRIRIGKVLLGDLPTGKWRYLRDNESF